MLPHFIVIGAMKAGTTSLFTYLSAHPEVFLHPRKELSFFVWPSHEQVVSRYEAFFTNAPPGARCGDVSTQYAKYPMFKEVPRRIAALLPDVRLIYAVRDPVRRAISHYHHEVLIGNSPAPIDEALRSDPIYVDFGRYRMQLSHYEPYFAPEQVHVVVLEELQRSPAGEMRRILQHIGCDPNRLPQNLDRRANVSSERVVLTPTIRAIQGHPIYRRIQYSLPRPVKQMAVRMLGRRPPKVSPPSAETLRWLADRFRDDSEELAQYLGRTQPIWPLDVDSSAAGENP